MKAVILAAGEGKRLRPLTVEYPKQLLNVGDYMIAEWQILWLKRYGVDEYIFAVEYMRHKFPRLLRDGSRYGVKIHYVRAKMTRGTADTLKAAKNYVATEQRFFVLNGDILTDLDPRPLLDLLGDAVGAIALVPLPSPYGVVVTENNTVKKFVEKPILKEYWINAGIYAFTPAIFDYIGGSISLEEEVFPLLAEKGLLKAVKYDGVVWKSIDTYKDYEEANARLALILAARLGLQ